LSSKAETLYALGEYQKAHTYYTRATKLNPDQNNNPELTNMSYFVYYLDYHDAKFKQYEHLRSEEIKKVENHADFLSAVCSQGENFINLSEYEKAVECYNKVLKLEPNSAGLWNDKGFALDKLGEHEKAIKYFDKAREKILLIIIKNIYGAEKVGFSNLYKNTKKL
jgi:tetratricopeptide (TPR) repeat protein